MPRPSVFVFDSTFPSADVALPIAEDKLHIIVSGREIDPPPGHRTLRLAAGGNAAAFRHNLRSLRTEWANVSGSECVVIAPPIVRPEQFFLNVVYALSLTRKVYLFDGVAIRPWHRALPSLLIAAARTAVRQFPGIRQKLQCALFDHKVKSLAARSTPEGALFGCYSRARSFSFALDRVTVQADGKSIYGEFTRGWHMPAFGARRKRYAVQTSRHRLHAATLHVGEVNGAEVSSVFRDGKILSYPYMLGGMPPHPTYRVSARKTVKTLERGICLLAYTTTYYHWLVEGVSRILDVMDDGLDFDQYPLILPPLPKFQRELLEVLGIHPDRQVVTLDKGDWCHVEECIFPTPSFPFSMSDIEDPSGQPDRTVLLRIRARLMERLKFPAAHAGAPKRIYISRAKAERRKFTPEHETLVMSVLESCGFQRIFLEELPWAMQVRTLADAEMVAGMHGAGLTNILFSDAKALLEFHNPMEARPYFAVFARELGMNYAYVVGSLRGRSACFDNITIDPALVAKGLRQLETAMSAPH
jgi:capsular polysaccharide biosynthesis protein